ncbi:MAG: VOC family protein [Deltaproteobacteria bacterium]|nr:VOC family protein [Deltaproteobacteria bacterium]NND29074.1 VOC family protein [Myxococcales bacterium]MBT8465883.1 VOC family protein [Deltaproteobacteria bacterium]MBT8480413.1 VOC family protein [Deltaproteobacteria bacterium]NNK08438.1 VOC family protein [Myxococcales bacterium]
MRFSWGTPVVAALIPMLGVMLGCSSSSTTLPPIAEDASARPIPGKFVWHNLITSDAEAARTFYGALFDWEFELKDGGRYSVISHRGRNVGGILDTTKTGDVPKRAHWLSAVSVTDLEASLRAVTRAGGKQLEAPIEVGGIGRVVTVEDADGALLHLLAPANGDPPDLDPAVHTWLWHELLANNPKRAVSFYEEAFGYQVKTVTRETGRAYNVLWSAGGPRAAVLENPFDDVRSVWIPYVRVEDPAALAGQVEALGGKVVIEPRPDVRNGTLAVVLDPSGAPVALQKWSPKSGAEEQR